MNKLSVIELFAGIGSQRSALDRLGIKHEVVGIAEIDKHAIKSYESIHGSTRNFGDIMKIERLPYADLWTYSFPCTDISLAGKQQGLQHDNKREEGLLGMLFEDSDKTVKNTRSGLLYEVQRLLWVAKEDGSLPKFLLLENVKALVGKKFMSDFQGWLDELDMIGYNSYWKVLNAKDYGIPQNRERVFVVSIRKDIDNGKFKWPMRFPLKLRLKDMLEDKVDEKYYLNDKQLKQIMSWNSQTNPIEEARTMEDETMQTITAKSNTSMNASMLLIKEYATYISWEDDKGRINTQDHRAFKSDSVSGTVPAMERGVPKVYMFQRPHGDNKGGILDGNVCPTITTSQWQENNYIAIPEATKQGYALAKDGDGVYLNRPHQKRGTVQDGMIQTIKTSGDDVGVVVYDDYNSQIRADQDTIGTLTTNIGNDAPRNGYKLIENNNKLVSTLDLTLHFENELIAIISDRNGKAYILDKSTGVLLRIRKLTPKECYRLMSFTDEQFDKAASVCSNSQLYKQAGNSICINVLYYIFKSLFIECYNYNQRGNENEIIIQKDVVAK